MSLISSLGKANAKHTRVLFSQKASLFHTPFPATRVNAQWEEDGRVAAIVEITAFVADDNERQHRKGKGAIHL